MTENIFSSEAKLIVTHLRSLYIKENPTLFYEFIVTFHASSVACSHSSLPMHAINLDFINSYVITLILKFLI